METTVLSIDSMLMVKDLETKVVSTEDGIELYVRVPIIWEDHETDGDTDATQSSLQEWELLVWSSVAGAWWWKAEAEKHTPESM